MSRKPYFPEGTYEEARELSLKAQRAPELRRLQSVMLGAAGLKASEISVITGLSVSRIRQVWMELRKKGLESLCGEVRGKNRGRAHLNLKEEEAFLASFDAEARQGKCVTANAIHEAHKEKLAKPIKKSVTYRLLKRHRWRKIVPRPEHPKHDPQKMKEFREAIFPPGYDPYED